MSVDFDDFCDLVDLLAGDPGCWGGETRVHTLGELQRMRGWLGAREAAVLEVSRLECDDVNSGAIDLIQLCQQAANVSFGEATKSSARPPRPTRPTGCM